MRIVPALLVMTFCLNSYCCDSAVSQVKEEIKADFALKLDFARLRENRLIKKYKVFDQLIDNNPNRIVATVLPPSLQRISLYIQLPENHEDLGELISPFIPRTVQRDEDPEAGPEPPKTVPFEFMVRVEYSDNEAENNYRRLKEQNARTKKVNGIDVLKGPLENSLDNISVYLDNSKTLVAATDRYVGKSEKDILVSDVAKSLAKMGDGKVLYFVTNFEKKEKLLNEGIDALMKSNRMLGSQLLFLKGITELQLFFDVENSPALNASLIGRNQESAEKAVKHLNGLLSFPKYGLSTAEKNPKLQGSEIQQFLKGLKNDLQFVNKENNLTLSISRPKNFESVAAQLHAIQTAEVKRIENLNRYRQIALSILNFESAYRRFPFIHDENSKFHKDLSWRFRILPFAEASNLQNSGDTKSAWDQGKNKALHEKMPSLFGSSKSKATVCWIQSDATRFSSITDGSSNTIMLLEFPEGVNWMEPKDLSVDQAVKLVKNLKDGKTLVAAFYDGSIRQLSSDIDEKDLRAMLTPRGNEVVNIRKLFSKR